MNVVSKYMSKLSIVMTFAVTIIFMCFISTQDVWASYGYQDGIEAEFNSVENEDDGTIEVELSVENTNGFDVKNLELNFSIPTGYALSKSSTLPEKKDVFYAKEKLSYKLVYEKEKTDIPKETESTDETVKHEDETGASTSPEEKTAQETTSQNTASGSESTEETVNQLNGNTSGNGNETTVSENATNTSKTPKTGDNMYAIVFVILTGILGAAVFIGTKNKKVKKILSIILCITMSGSIVSGFYIGNAYADDEYVTNLFRLSDSVTVDSEEIELSVTIKYDYPNAELANIIFNTEGMLYDRVTDRYYLFDKKDILDGSIREYDGLSKLEYEIKGTNDYELLSGEAESEKEWKIDDFGLVVGENTITVSIEYEDGTKDSASIKVNNLCKENMETLDLDMNDDDNDGVLNYIELMNGTDPENPDTDGDSLSDYDEIAILGTDPTQKDTDHNGVEDALEDADEDLLTNYDEIYVYKTNPVSIDSDGDGLNDSDEINVYKTDSNNADTDGDGASDYWEVKNGFDPLVYNEDFGNSKPDEYVEIDEDVEVTLVLNDPFINDSTPGYVGVDPYYVELGDKESANLTISFDNSALDENDDLSIYYFNEETQRLEPVETTVSEDGKATATISKDGTYVLLNRRYVTDVWENDIIPPSMGGVESGSMDIVFVIDRSQSMDDNDPDRIRIEVVKQFIDKLRDKDKAAIVQFTAIAETIAELTGNKEKLKAAADGIENSDGGGCGGSDDHAGTNGAAGIRNALDELKKSEAQHKYVIFLTDGADTTTPDDYTYEDLEKEAVESNIAIYTVGLVGSGSVNTEILQSIADATNGKYYLATTGKGAEEIPEDIAGIEDVYDDIENITIDRHLDSNNDGISDYYTKLICDGKLLTAQNAKIFGDATYEEVQANADYDGDGLLNGEEVVIMESEHAVYGKLHSYPDRYDSDGDGLNDYDELKVYGTSPLRFNRYAEANDVEWVTDSKNFVSDKYKRFYDSAILGDLEAGSVFIGNKLFGTSYEDSVLCEQILVQYFDNINDTILAKKELQLAQNFSSEITYEIFSVIQEAADQSDNIDELKELYNLTLEIIKDIPNAEDKIDISSLEELKTKDSYIGRIDYIISQAKDMKDSIFGAEIVGFTVKDQYYNCCEKIFKAYSEKMGKVSSLDNKLVISEKLEAVGRKVDAVFYVKDVIEEGYDSYKEYQNLIANMSVIADNIYILDAIIANGINYDKYFESDNLIRAAKNLKYELEYSYDSDVATLTGFLTSYAYTLPIFEKELGEYVHAVIADCGTPGAIVELVRTVGNLALNIDDVSKECTKLYAIATVSDILSEKYNTYLKAGNGIKSDKYWIFYTDNGDIAIKYLYNLFVARITSEEQMINADEENSFLIEWLFTKIIYKESDCKDNIKECINRMTKY